MPSPKKLPKWHKVTLEIDPYQGVAHLAIRIEPFEGYVFYDMNRRGTKAVIRYLRADCVEAAP